MKRGKTEFTFTVNVEPDRIEGVIRSYLQANKFKKIPKPVQIITILMTRLSKEKDLLNII